MVGRDVMNPLHIKIIDVRVNDKAQNGEQDIHREILAGLGQPTGQKTLPTLLLYNEAGLRIYEEITTDAEQYYLFGAEESILKTFGDDIVQAMHSGSGGKLGGDEVVVELGAGALRKTSHILSALARLVPHAMSPPPITYYALDLEKRELERTLDQLSTSSVGPELEGKVTTKGMWGTYDGGLKFIEEGGIDGHGSVEHIAAGPNSPERPRLPSLSRAREQSPASDSASSAGATYITGTDQDSVETTPSTPGSSSDSKSPLHILFLGSSLGNFSRGADAEFLKALPLRPGSGDTLLLGLDHGKDKEKIEKAYDDDKGITRKFAFNGLKAAGEALGDPKLFDPENWEYVGKYNEEERRHEAYFVSKISQTIHDPQSRQDLAFVADEHVNFEISTKYSEEDAFKLFTNARLRPIQRWTDSSGYSLWLLERPPFSFPLLPAPSSATPSPLSNTPFGVPSFQDFQDMWAAWDFITRKMIPESMLFQKPIDLRHICLFYCGHIPTFLDIHLTRLLDGKHTEPEEFKYIFERGIDPNVDDPSQCHPHSEVPQNDEDWPSLDSILKFQDRVRQRVRNLYDDLESGKIELTRKIGRVLFMVLEHEGFHAETLLYMLLQRAGTGTIPPSGFTPPPWSSLVKSWGAQPVPESPTVTLGPTTISLGHDDDERLDEDPKYRTDIKDHEFGWDNEHPVRKVDVGEFKISWRPVTNGEFYEYWSGEGKQMVQFPKSWVEENGEVMVRTMYGPIPIKTAWKWPIVTSYNNLSTYASVKGGRLPTEPELRLFYDKFECGYEGGKNVAFRNWHPIPATTGVGEAGGGKGHNGGVFEWTSSLFEKHEGFLQSILYPGYSTDFFDGHHNVVIGGSYATIPRLSERRTLRNYYQQSYPYAWVGGRIVYDVQK